MPDNPIICLDAAYAADAQSVAAVVFPDWPSEKVLDVWSERIEEPPEAYKPGRFFERELPLLVRALDQLAPSVTPSTIVIDGYVVLDEAGRPGLGAHLYAAFDESVPVIGAAKTPFRGAEFAAHVRRGGARTPLYVSAIGVDLPAAAEKIRAMAGRHRIPDHLKRVDRAAREALDAPAEAARA